MFPVRLLIFSFLLMYGRTAALIIVVLVLAVSNFILAFFLLRTKLYKNVFTAFSGNGILKNSNSTYILPAIVMPGSIFYSRHSFISRERTQKKFQNFSLGNSIVFLIVGNVVLCLNH